MSIKKPYRGLDKLNSDFRKKVDLFMGEVGSQVFITETWRSEERQKYLINTGASKTSHSNHQDGLAIDIAFSGSELYPSDHSKWEKIGKVANKYGMDWGYDLWAHLGFVDKPHFQDNGKPMQGPYRDLAGESVIKDQKSLIEAIRTGTDDEAEAAVQIIFQREMKKMVKQYKNK